MKDPWVVTLIEMGIRLYQYWKRKVGRSDHTSDDIDQMKGVVMFQDLPSHMKDQVINKSHHPIALAAEIAAYLKIVF